MLSLIEVECPHCKAQGRIVSPPLGSIIVGPCPECSGKVVVFCGKVLALDDAIMTHGTTQQRQEHLLEVIGVFVQGRIETLFSDRAESDGSNHFGVLGEDTAEAAPTEPVEPVEPVEPARRGALPIGEDEVAQFVRSELHKLDDPDYFKAIFR